MAKGEDGSAPLREATIGSMTPTRVLAIATLAVFVACSTYGAEDAETPPADSGTSSSGGSTSSSGNASSSGGSSSGSTDGSVADVADAGPTFNETCPPCAGTCVPSGCNGAGPNTACNKPYDVTAGMTLVVFACPEGMTVPLPNQAPCQNGGPKHGALLRLGAAPTKWNVKANGSNPFAVGGDCSGITSGACSSSSVNRDFDPFITIVVGSSTNDIQSCVQINVELTPS